MSRRGPSGGMVKANKQGYNALTGTWSSSTVLVSIESAPFDEGAMRSAYRMWEMEGSSRLPFVCKFYKTRQPKEVCMEDAKLNMIAQSYADDFNRKANVSQKIAFVPSYFMELENGALCCSEPVYPLIRVQAHRTFRQDSASPNLDPLSQVLAGNYEKHNNNDGIVGSERLTPQAFSHYTYEASGHDLLICDIQGVGNYFTDPQIHSKDGKGFGLGNCGLSGIRRFMETHQCSDLCRRLKLPPMALPGPLKVSRSSSGRDNPGRHGGSSSTVLAQRIAESDRNAACARDEQIARELQQLELNHHGGRRLR